MYTNNMGPISPPRKRFLINGVYLNENVDFCNVFTSRPSRRYAFLKKIGRGRRGILTSMFTKEVGVLVRFHSKSRKRELKSTFTVKVGVLRSLCLKVKVERGALTSMLTKEVGVLVRFHSKSRF